MFLGPTQLAYSAYREDRRTYTNIYHDSTMFFGNTMVCEHNRSGYHAILEKYHGIFQSTV